MTIEAFPIAMCALYTGRSLTSSRLTPGGSSVPGLTISEVFILSFPTRKVVRTASPTSILRE